MKCEIGGWATNKRWVGRSLGNCHISAAVASVVARGFRDQEIKAPIKLPATNLSVS